MGCRGLPRASAVLPQWFARGLSENGGCGDRARGDMTDGRGSVLLLLCRVGSQLCGLPVEHVSETMRPLPIEPIVGAPTFVLGVSIIRNLLTPIIDAGRLLVSSDRETRPTRFVVLRVGERPVALTVDAVVGVRALSTAALRELPPLLRAAGEDLVQSVGTLDAALLVVLQSGRLVPDSVWAAIDSIEARP
jgi:purine-binding chemotaxis protein CheW